MKGSKHLSGLSWRKFLAQVALLGCALGSSLAQAGQVHAQVPQTVDTKAHYLFYMHGVAIELGGRRAMAYDYRGITRALAERGFEVIGEERSAVPPQDYADKVAAQVQALLKAGVPASRITVAGHSKGGFIAMLVMSLVREPQMGYVNFAGCGLPGSGFEGGMRIATREAPQARGRLLSAYERSDSIAGTCKAALELMAQASATEQVLDMGGGHELFYRADKAWLDVLQNWAQPK
jgi:dienelactone hydrolase